MIILLPMRSVAINSRHDTEKDINTSLPGFQLAKRSNFWGLVSFRDFWFILTYSCSLQKMTVQQLENRMIQ